MEKGPCWDYYFAQLVKKPPYTQPDNPLSYLQDTTNGSCQEWVELSPHSQILLLYVLFQYHPTIYAWISHMDSLLLFFWTKQSARAGSGTTHWVLRALSSGLKRMGREADHSPQSDAETRNTFSYTSCPPTVLLMWCLIKHNENFIYMGTNTDY
jgi:hypothetical protein